MRWRAGCAGPYPDPDFHQLDSWIVIRQDNTATFFVGKTDLGQGTGTAFRQIMCDELDIAYEKTSCVMGSTHNTVDQGGSGGSDALQTDGYPMRRVAAEARRVLLDMAAKEFGVPVTALVVSDGVISVRDGNTTGPGSISYGDLIGGRKFNVTLTGKNTDTTTGVAPLKPVQEMKNVGKSPQRYDIPAKVDGSLEVGRRREGSGHGPRAQRAAAGRRRHARQHRRSVGARHSRVHQGREQGQLRRGGVRARGAGDPRGPAAQGRVEEAGHRALPRVGRSLHVHAQRDAIVYRQAGRDRRDRCGVRRRGHGDRGRVRRAVPGPHRDSARRTRWPIRRTISSPSTPTT